MWWDLFHRMRKYVAHNPYCRPCQLQGKSMKEEDNFKSKKIVKCTRMREIASTSFTFFWGTTPRPPITICPPHSQKADDVLARVKPLCAIIMTTFWAGETKCMATHWPNVEGDGHQRVEDDDIGPECEEGWQGGVRVFLSGQEDGELISFVDLP